MENVIDSTKKPHAANVSSGSSLFAYDDMPPYRISEIPEYSDTMLSWNSIKSLIPIIRALSEMHGDFASVKSNIIRLCNTGHTFSIVCPTKEDLVKAQASLNEFVSGMRPMLGGLNGVINQMLSQLSTDGAISCEGEAEFSSFSHSMEPFPIRIAAIHQVDVRSLHLEYEPASFGYVPYQIQKDMKDPVRLPESTYQLQVFKAMPDPHPPYPVPPMIAGLQEAKRQKEALHSIDRAMQKIGLLGIMDATLDPPERYDDEEPEAYEARMKSILQGVAKMIGKSMSQGVYAHYGALNFKFTNFGTEFAGTLPFLEHGQQRLSTALQNDWAADNKAQASGFMSIIYEKVLNEMMHYQHLVTNPIERYAKINLLLQGLCKGFTTYDVAMSLDQDSIRYWENEVVKNSVARNLVDMGVDPEEALKFIGSTVHVRDTEKQEQGNNSVMSAIMSQMSPYKVLHQRVVQGLFRYSAHAGNGGCYTLEKVNYIKVSDL